jgi:hypothetical protein
VDDFDYSQFLGPVSRVPLHRLTPHHSFTFDWCSSDYRGGVYVDLTNATDSNHDVEVVGWGYDKEAGFKYWIARNSCESHNDGSWQAVMKGVCPLSLTTRSFVHVLMFSSYQGALTVSELASIEPIAASEEADGMLTRLSVCLLFHSQGVRMVGSRSFVV